MVARINAKRLIVVEHGGDEVTKTPTLLIATAAVQAPVPARSRAAAALFLTSTDTSHVNATALPVNGGLSSLVRYVSARIEG